MKRKPSREETLSIRNDILTGLHEFKKIYDSTMISYRKKPEYLFKISHQRTKMRIAKMIELLRRLDPQFENILFRHLDTEETIINN